MQVTHLPWPGHTHLNLDLCAPTPRPAPQSMYKSYTRLPAQLLLDPSPDGPLAIIASACGEHMKAKALKRIDWSAPQSRKEVGGHGCRSTLCSPRAGTPAGAAAAFTPSQQEGTRQQYSLGLLTHACGLLFSLSHKPVLLPAAPTPWCQQNLELLARIRAELLRGGYVRTPCVYVHPACGAAAPKLQEAVRGLKGEVAQSEGASGVTHVVHPFGDGGDPDKGERYARTLEVRGARGGTGQEWVQGRQSQGGAQPSGTAMPVPRGAEARSIQPHIDTPPLPGSAHGSVTSHSRACQLGIPCLHPLNKPPPRWGAPHPAPPAGQGRPGARALALPARLVRRVGARRRRAAAHAAAPPAARPLARQHALADRL